MGWAKFDDQFTDHPKVVAAGPWAELLAMRAVIYSARHETDGQIKKAVLTRISVGIPSPKKHVDALVREGLWDEDEEGDGWWVHDFLDYHPSREDKDEERAQARERMRKARSQKRSQSVRANTDRTDAELPENESRSSRNPDPARTPKASAAEDGFTEFNVDRAAAEVKRRQGEGLPVKNPGGLQRTIAADADFVAESKRLWAHRDCANCKGRGHTEDWSPGGGTAKVPCQEPI